MTAPANTLLPVTAAQRPRREAAPAAAALGARHGETPGFAAHLAREVPSAAKANAAPAKPGRLAHTHPPAATPDDTTPEPSAETGKTQPATRQKPAASLAAFALAATQVLDGTPTRSGETTEPTAKTAADTPDTEAAALVLVLPGGAPQLPPATASSTPTASDPAGPTAARSQPQPADSAPIAGPIAAPLAAPIALGAAQLAHPAAFAAASLVLEHDAAPPAPESAPGNAAPDSAVQTAARAQPSTLAALTGAPEPERPAARKLRTEIETPRAAPLPAPEFAGSLALAQQAPAQPSFAPGPEATAGPQPLSFDQLVDSIARARDGAEQGGPVAVAMRHAEFGRISLRIESDGAGLAVAMTSQDPTFAPAVAAAHAAAASIEATRAPHSTQTAESSEAASRDSAQGHASGHSGQRHEAPRAPQRSAPRGEASATSARRNGIFA